MRRFQPDIFDHISRTGLTVVRFCEAAGIAESTLYNAFRYPDRDVRRLTAWRVARAYARLMGVDEKTAYNLLIREESDRLRPTFARN